MANQPTKYRKFVVGAASAALVASAVAPVASAKDFSDTKGNTHEAAIDALSDANIITGYEDGTFKPNKTLTRSDVVKMMGKWLVSEGYEVPGDYKTNMRFSDLTASTNDELLKFAAVVKDNGVFNGSNGRLLAGDNMSRENMAVVLVRAFDTVNDINLVEYVEGQDFKKEVTDLNSAKSEARTAINVLDFFDVTTVAQFNPKDTTTRGHFATFLNNFLKADLSQVTGVVSGVESITAVNNTTVEVKFVDAVEDLAALDFAIEGLKIDNKVVKQTDAKTVVLTTAVQEGGKTYTVTANGNKLGTFNGVSAVVPTKIAVTTPSLQGVIGKDVTVTATVEVPEGQSKAGVPVTFNITNSNSNNNEKLEAVAYTDDKGVASYTYTRYYSSEDNVAAYATHKSSVVSSGKVYWANAIQLAVSEITTGNDLANETKKSYKVTGKANTTYYIAIKENLDVKPNEITDVKVQNHGTQNFVTPYELTTGAEQFASVTTNSNGEGSFTVYGANLSATPIVYLPSSVNTDAKDYSYSKLALQSEAPTVKFSQVDRLAIAVVGEGTADSAEYYGTVAPVRANANSAGGRTYTVTVTDKDGKVAPAGTVAHVKFDDMAGDVYFSTANSNFVKLAKNDIKALTVGKDGKVQFRVAGKGATSYVKPTVFLNTTGTVSPVVLDKTDVQSVAEVTYFKTPVVTNAELTVTDVNGNEITSIEANEDAYFTYQSVDQNGFAYRPGNYTVTPGSTTIIYVQETDPVTGVVTFVPKEVTNNPITANSYVLAFDVTSTFGQAVVKNPNGTVIPAVQNIGSTKTYHVTSDANGEAVVRITSQSVDTVSVNVTGASNILPTTTASVNFTASNVLPAVYTGDARINDVAETITFKKANGTDYKAVSYANATFADGTGAISKSVFEAKVKKDATSGKHSEVTSTRDANGKYHFVYRGVGTVGIPVVNNKPVSIAVDKTYTLGAANDTIAITSLATDTDGDTLSFVGAVESTNPAVAQALTSGSNLVISVGSTTGTTTLTVNVTDGKETIAVSFDVTVDPVAYFSITGNPAVSYAAGTPGSVTIAAPTVTTTGNLVVKVGSNPAVNVNLLDGSSLDDIVSQINTWAGSLVTASKDGADLVVTSKTAEDLTLVGDGTLAGNNIATSTTGNAGTATKAKYSFKVAGAVPVGKVITVKVGSKTYTHTVAAGETTAAGIAAGIATTIGNANTAAGEYNATATGDSVVLEQAVAASNEGIKLTVTNN